MSKARLVITAVTVEGRSQHEIARAYGLSQGWVSRLLARYRSEGEAAFEPRSRRPETSPNATSKQTLQLILSLRQELTDKGLDAGPETIVWHLQHHHQITVSRATVSRCLARSKLVVPSPQKRPKSSYTRFEASFPNETWQADFTHFPLVDGTDCEILSFLDDHSRFALSLSAHRHVTGATVLDAFRSAIRVHGTPTSTLTDNGMVFTTRLSGGRGGRNGFESELQRLRITQKNSRPNHPTTCGKVERFQQTLKKWLRQQSLPRSLDELQALLDLFLDEYNHRRPHKSLPHRATPATVYSSLPKASPLPLTTNNHARVRHDRIDNEGKITLRHAGRLFHIGVGRTHARTHVLMLVHDLDIRVVHAATGELLRALTLDPSKSYQPTGRPPGPRPSNPDQKRT